MTLPPLIISSTFSSSTRSIIRAAQSLSSQPPHLLLCSPPSSHLALASKCPSLSSIFHTTLQTPESLTPLLSTHLDKHPHSHILSPSDTFSKSLLPRIAGHLQLPCLTDVTAIHASNEFSRPIYAGNAIARVRTPAASENHKPTILSARPSAWEPVDQGEANVDVVEINGEETDHCVVVGKEDGAQGLEEASVVVTGGRGVGKEGFGLVREVADLLGGQVGATRVAVDEGWVGNEIQVGQTGKIVAPKLYVAVGVSGAIQHIAGMRESDIVVAINKDAEAPIFDVADYGIIADWKTVLEELKAKLAK